MKTARVPICGMEVDPAKAAATAERNGEVFYFCSHHCRQTFLAADNPAGHACCGAERGDAAARKPANKYFCPMCDGVESDTPGSCPKCGMALERNALHRAPRKTLYTCPMHPEIERDAPGSCPICGMALEPKNIAAGDEEDDSELRDMTRRFRIGARAERTGVHARDVAHAACRAELADE